MSYDIRFTNQFKKDIKLAKKQGKDIDKLFDVVEIIAKGESLAPKYRDHDLGGNYQGCRECHIEPDWLLIYEIDNGLLVLLLNRVGSHSELFKETLINSMHTSWRHIFRHICSQSLDRPSGLPAFCEQICQKIFSPICAQQLISVSLSNRVRKIHYWQHLIIQRQHLR